MWVIIGHRNNDSQLAVFATYAALDLETLAPALEQIVKVTLLYSLHLAHI